MLSLRKKRITGAGARKEHKDSEVSIPVDIFVEVVWVFRNDLCLLIWIFGDPFKIDKHTFLDPLIV